MMFAILGCFGMAIIYGLKINLSINIVAMVNQSAIKVSFNNLR
jgi:ACS family sodium-dependent inorganic phosphate cotransporter